MNIYTVSFLEAMKNCNSPPDNSEAWGDIIHTYDTYYLNYKGDRTPKIPKILHQVWLGSPFPQQYQTLVDRWQRDNPSWEFKLWTDKTIAELGLINQGIYDKTKNYSAKSDIIRFEVLYRFGGVYTDTDYYFLKPFDDLLYLDFFTGCIGTHDNAPISPNFINSVLGSVPGHKIPKHMMDVMASFEKMPATMSEIMGRGPELLNVELKKFLKEPMVSVFPTSFFCPFPAATRYLIRGLSLEEIEKVIMPYAHEETHTMHLWYCSWQKGLAL